VNWEASHPADRKELQGAVQNGRLVEAEGRRNNEVIVDRKADWS